MITIYKSTDGSLTRIAEPISGSWINVIDPTPGEIAQIEALGIPQDYITHPLDLDERSRTERENGEQLIIFRIPYFQGEDVDIPYTTIPLGIILTDQYIITVCKLENEFLNEFASGSIKGLNTIKCLRFVLRLLLKIADEFLSDLRKINKAVDILEDQLEAYPRNKEILALLKYQKSLTYFTTGLKSNELLLQRLSRSQLFTTHPEDEDLLEDALTENQQAIEMTVIASGILFNMMDAFASIISNNMNDVMKFLASITIVLSLPTLVTGIYGMNVGLPLQNHPLSFYFTLALAFGTSLVVVLIFWRRNWL